MYQGTQAGLTHFLDVYKGPAEGGFTPFEICVRRGGYMTQKCPKFMIKNS